MPEIPRPPGRVCHFSAPTSSNYTVVNTTVWVADTRKQIASEIAVADTISWFKVWLRRWHLGTKISNNFKNDERRGLKRTGKRYSLLHTEILCYCSLDIIKLFTDEDGLNFYFQVNCYIDG